MRTSPGSKHAPGVAGKRGRSPRQGIRKQKSQRVADCDGQAPNQRRPLC